MASSCLKKGNEGIQHVSLVPPKLRIIFSTYFPTYEHPPGMDHGLPAVTRAIPLPWAAFLI
jgi:hypothetical protein